jgi:hypothetical protein
MMLKSFLFLTVIFSAIVRADNPFQNLTLNFPELKNALNRQVGERIEGFSVLVYCGHIEAITHIPVDWNIKVIRGISTVDRPGVIVEELLASAGHGASWIPYDEIHGIDELNNIISITTNQPECFDINAKFAIKNKNQQTRNINFPLSKIGLNR